MYQITCTHAYSILGETSIGIPSCSRYNLIAESIYYPGCFLVESISLPHIRLIIPRDRVQEISSINSKSEAADL